jgi:hypothetical protein
MIMKKNNKINFSNNSHTWRFFRAGGFDQVKLDSGKDLLAIEQLDQKLWVALACPIDNVNFDTRTLSLIDTDGDRRVRATELIAAIKWAASLLKNPDDLINSSEILTIQAINDQSDEGKVLITAGRNALNALGKENTDGISVAETESLGKVLSQRVFNGDGIITDDTIIGDDSLKEIVVQIIGALGGIPDRSGKLGINTEKIDAYFALARAYEIWFTESEHVATMCAQQNTTQLAAKAILAVREKIDDYFARCAIAEFDERTVDALNGSEKEFSTIGCRLISQNCNEIENLPLARIIPQSPLPLTKDINPYWIDKISSFWNVAVKPVLGPVDMLRESQWRNLLEAFTPMFVWMERKPTILFDSVDIEKIRELISGTAQEKLTKLVAADSAESATFDALVSLEKLVRFHRDLYRLCTNFVNFKDFYANQGPAIFQAGTLYLDQRSCNLCIKVEDANKHSMMAAMAGTYLVYCECKRHAGEKKLTIVAALTNGDSENLIVGRNGVFYDRIGNDWDATIVKIIENPISIRQAFWLPYKSLVRMIESQVAKRATAADAQSTERLSQTAAFTANVDRSKPEPLPPPKKLDIGIVAALGVAAGALGTFIATLCGYAAGIIKLGPLAIIGALAGVVVLVSGPSIVLAYIKLRKRNLGPILDAGGWAINAKARINVPFGTVLTQIAVLPQGAQRDLIDPYAEKKSPWPKVVTTALLIYIVYAALNHLGFVNEWTSGRVGIKKEKMEKSVVLEKKSSQSVVPVSLP